MDLDATFGLQPFTREMAIAGGLTAWQWRRVRPHLIRLDNGVFLLRWADDARTRHCQRVAGLLLPKKDHFAVGMSAVAILGLPDPPFHSWDQQVPQIGGKKTRTARGIRGNHAVPIPTQWGDCTDAVTTAIHIAGQLPLPEALMVTDAVARRLADTDNRIELASEECRERARRLLAEDHDLPALMLANPAAEAPSESFYRGHMILEGYEDPRCGVPRIDAKGKQRYIDILLENLAIEVDGDEKLQRWQDLLDEKEREDDLRLTGLSFLRTRVKPLYADPQARMAELDRKVTEVRRLNRLTG
jgi:hypothetical protein